MLALKVGEAVPNMSTRLEMVLLKWLSCFLRSHVIAVGGSQEKSSHPNPTGVYLETLKNFIGGARDLTSRRMI